MTDKINQDFFQATVVSILYGCTTWTLTQHIVEKREGDSTRMIRALLNKFWKQHLMKQQLQTLSSHL